MKFFGLWVLGSILLGVLDVMIWRYRRFINSVRYALSSNINHNAIYISYLDGSEVLIGLKNRIIETP